MKRIKDYYNEKIAQLKSLNGKTVLVWVINRIKRITYHEIGHLVILGIVLSCVFLRYQYPSIVQTSDSTKSISYFNYEEFTQVDESVEARFHDFPEVKTTDISQNQGPSFLYSKATDGRTGFSYQQYQLTYDMLGNVIKKEPIAERVIQEAQDIEYRPGSVVKIGAYYHPVYSRYGVDCVGCSGQYTGVGNFAMGVHYNKNYGVRQYDGTFSGTITYEGYYIIATDRSIPFCTVVEIKNHQFVGAGIENNVPFQAIVLDRGGAITGNRIDLFIGMQTNMEITYGKRLTYQPITMTIIKFGSWQKNALGQHACKL